MKHFRWVRLRALPTNIRLVWKKNVVDKHSSLLQKFVTFGQKKFYIIGSRRSLTLLRSLTPPSISGLRAKTVDQKLWHHQHRQHHHHHNNSNPKNRPRTSIQVSHPLFHRSKRCPFRRRNRQTVTITTPPPKMPTSLM